MNEQFVPSSLNRRSFIKQAGLLVGATAVVPSGLKLDWLRPAPKGDALKIGLLLSQPRQAMPQSVSLMAGLDLYFEQVDRQVSGRPLQLLPKEIGLDPGLALRQAQRLIEQERVDLVVALAERQIVGHLRETFHNSRIPLLVTNAGANIIQPAERDPYIFYNTLGLWQASFATGRWVTQHIGPRVFIAAALYDSGYDTVYAFRRGVESAGGEIIDTHVTHFPFEKSHEDLRPLLNAIVQAQPDLVYGFYCGQPAVDFLTGYAEAGLTRRIPLAGIALMTDQALLPVQGRAALDIYSALPWAEELNLIPNHRFTTAYQAKMDQPADLFALLGYDTAQLIGLALETTNGQTKRPDRLLEALATASFVSPRGPVQMAPVTHHLNSPLYLRQVRAHGGRLKNIVVDELQPLSRIDHNLLDNAEARSGWFNPYLVV